METSFGEEKYSENSNPKERDVLEKGGRVAMQVNLIDNSPQENNSISTLKEQEKMRPRRDGGGRCFNHYKC
jgi:hypothetical protein